MTASLPAALATFLPWTLLVLCLIQVSWATFQAMDGVELACKARGASNYFHNGPLWPRPEDERVVYLMRWKLEKGVTYEAAS